jgi:hypothetical protein
MAFPAQEKARSLAVARAFSQKDKNEVQNRGIRAASLVQERRR